jgi:vacuolar-type H+-ATPase subunit D/Vma8
MWILGIFVALGATWGMTSQRINAMERDIDRIEEEIKNINKKLDR